MKIPDQGSSSGNGDAAANGLIIVGNTNTRNVILPSKRGIKEWARMIALHVEALSATSNGTSDSERKWQDYHLDMINLAKSRISLICRVNNYFPYRQS